MSGQYIFAITDAAAGVPPLADFMGFDDSTLIAVEQGSIAAIVSPVKKLKIRPRRKNLKIHHEAVSGLMQQSVVLPMAFGMVAEDEEEVRDFLARNEAHLRDQITMMRGRVEMGIKLRWNLEEDEDFFSFILSLAPELAEMRDRLTAGGRQPSHEEKIALGQTFASTLDLLKNERSQMLIDGLAEHYERLQVNDVREDAEVANLAFLVQEDDAQALEDKIMELAGELEDRLLIKLSGPLAPYSFIDVALS